MKKLFGSLASKLSPPQHFTLHANNNPTSLPPVHLTQDKLFQYRKHRGVNLGSWFVLERWISESPFHHARQPAQSDLDVALGMNAKEILERHWDTWITQDDWEWIVAHGLNAVRIPIGYYHLCSLDASILTRTDFDGLQNVFMGAWSRILRAIETANSYGIGVLLDLHAAAGKQNRDAHSGTSKPPTFFASRFNQEQTIHALRVLLNALGDKHPNAIGVELLNEPDPPREDDLKAWYTTTIRQLQKANPSIPLYLGDHWQMNEYVSYITGLKAHTLVAVDHHVYRCFTSADIHTPVHQHIQAFSGPSGPFPQLLARSAESLGRSGAGLVIGEWSGALNPGSLIGGPNEVRDYVAAQLVLFEQHCSGWFFWTYKKERPGDTGWSLRDAVATEQFPEWVGLRLKVPSDIEQPFETESRERFEKEAFGKATHIQFAIKQ
ncbi:hypothetical protein AX16_002557 [Volvariella volvacea WC 439]|nr:hypothetical protein AX16_002557 [Volvariella volvacea WC 439]